jgi:hypothetical protein
MYLEAELKRKIVTVVMPKENDGLVHVTFENEGGNTYQAGMTLESWYTLRSLRKLLNSMSMQQIPLLEAYLENKAVSDEEDRIDDLD